MNVHAHTPVHTHGRAQPQTPTCIHTCTHAHMYTHMQSAHAEKRNHSIEQQGTPTLCGSPAWETSFLRAPWMYTHTRPCTHTVVHTHIHPHAYTHVHTHTCTRTHVHAHTYTHTRTRTLEHAHTHTPTCIAHTQRRETTASNYREALPSAGPPDASNDSRCVLRSWTTRFERRSVLKLHHRHM